MTERELPGGAINLVIVAGNTVRRPLSPRSEFVRPLLDLLAGHRWPGAPRFLGVDDLGREVLSYLPGHAAWEPDQPADVRCEESLRRVAELVREFHDLTAGTELAGSCEVVCHNDLSPPNTVYRDLGSGLRPVAFIDWDLAAPGRRIHDLAHVCWQYLDIGPGSWAAAEPGRSGEPDEPSRPGRSGEPSRPSRPGEPGGSGVTEIGRLIRVICDGYGLDDRSGVLDAVLWWQDRCWRGIEAGADRGEPAMLRLRDDGAVAAVRAAYRWTLRHADLMAAGLR
ncbi:MAG TPA: phosphotransferase [Streptosporangiaceae bacterium]|nr:phosphotransferase [Streptosporangiaceae bacterium]